MRSLPQPHFCSRDRYVPDFSRQIAALDKREVGFSTA
jgi:hypothetical protein